MKANNQWTILEQTATHHCETAALGMAQTSCLDTSGNECYIENNAKLNQVENAGQTPQSYNRPMNLELYPWKYTETSETFRYTTTET